LLADYVRSGLAAGMKLPDPADPSVATVRIVTDTARIVVSSEEYEPASLVRQARMAEQAGFEALWISDHFHPWLDEQGQSSFVWAVIGAISQATNLPITTSVTCPTTRIHPAIIAQAAATASLLTDGKFNLGVGTGEALNEHVTGAKWPAADERQEMLEEAVPIITELFTGE
jgi:G6PDH family F420-dependent oxidoreductase